jgi:hypothetical protein
MFFDLATVASATSNNLQRIVTSTHLKKFVGNVDCPYELS